MDQQEWIKQELKIELKRLQRQNGETIKDFEHYKKLFDTLSAKIINTEKNQVLSETAMATIFKLLRIQYALSHQDEVDKQDIFLMGQKDVENPYSFNNPKASIKPERTAGADLNDSLESVQQTFDQFSVMSNSANPMSA